MSKLEASRHQEEVGASGSTIEIRVATHREQTTAIQTRNSKIYVSNWDRSGQINRGNYYIV